MGWKTLTGRPKRGKQMTLDIRVRKLVASGFIQLCKPKTIEDYRKITRIICSGHRPEGW